jgi:hypothetical protein
MSMFSVILQFGMSLNHLSFRRVRRAFGGKQPPEINLNAPVFYVQPTGHVLPGDKTTLRNQKTRLNFNSIRCNFTKFGILVIRILGHLRHPALHLHPYLKSGLRPKGRPRYLSQDLRSARLTTRCAMISLPPKRPRQSGKPSGQQRMPDQLFRRKIV